MMMHDCSPQCVSWTGTNKCHCTQCGQTFTVVGNFDSHRERGRCVKPDTVGLEQNRYGVWKTPGEVDLGDRFGRD